MTHALNEEVAEHSASSYADTVALTQERQVWRNKRRLALERTSLTEKLIRRICRLFERLAALPLYDCTPYSIFPSTVASTDWCPSLSDLPTMMTRVTMLPLSKESFALTVLSLSSKW